MPKDRLTYAVFWESLEFPKVTGVTVALAVPHAAKRAVFFILAILPPRFGAGQIEQGDVQYPRGLAAVTAGERRLAFFVPKIPTVTRCFMSFDLAPYLHHIHSVSESSAIGAFIQLNTIRENLALVWEMLDMADRNDESLYSLSAVAGLVERQIFEVERLCEIFCPEMGEIMDAENNAQ